jgi:hypothetical protein
MVVVFRMTATGAYKASRPSYLKQMFPAHLLITKFFLDAAFFRKDSGNKLSNWKKGSMSWR